jgi:hypothetical protein
MTAQVLRPVPDGAAAGRAPPLARFVVKERGTMIEPAATSLVPFLPAARRRLDIIEPMLGDLETATTAGCQYIMGKLLRQLAEAAGSAERHLSELQRRAVRNSLAVLRRESERLLPDTDTFVRGARMLTETLSLV